MTATDVVGVDDTVRRRGLDAVFRPRSVAVLGASGREGNPFARPLANLVDLGFPGPVYPVNPAYPELHGLPCYRSLDVLPGPVDLVLLLVPAPSVPEAVDACVRIGARAAVVFASGFAETGPAGQAVQRDAAARARAGGLLLIGPNCQGVVSVPARMAGTFTAAVGDGLPAATGVAYVGQSGAVGGSVLDLARESGMGMSFWVSTGNQADTGALEIADFLLDDPSARVLALYLESVDDGARYAGLARRARAMGKHLVVLRSGRSAAGRRASASHTGAMTGADAAFDVVCAEEGVHLVDDVDSLLLVAHALSALPAAPGPRVAVVTTSGGAGGLAADHCEATGLRVDLLPAQVQDELATLVPDFGATTNPVDVTAQLFSRGVDAFGHVCRLVARCAEVDALVVVLTMVTGESGRVIATELTEVARSLDKPVVLVWLAGREQTAAGRSVCRDAGFPVLGSLREAAEVIRALLPQEARGGRTADPARARRAVQLPAIPGRARVLGEHDGGPLLDAVGVPRPRSRLVATAEDAADAATALGPRVVLKAASADLPHKSDVGGVRLGVPAAEAAHAHGELLAAVRAARPDAAVEGVLVQETVLPGVEVLVGVTASAVGLPHVLTVGIGGTATELYRDIASVSLPAGPEAVAATLHRLRGFPLLAGHRGAAGHDVPALVDAVVAIGDLALAIGDRLVELEVNPLFVHGPGGGVTAADLLVHLRPELPEDLPDTSAPADDTEEKVR